MAKDVLIIPFKERTILKQHNPKTLLISASDFNNDSRLQRLHGHAKELSGSLVTIAYGKSTSDKNILLSPIPVRSLFARLFDVSKMLVSRILSDNQLIRLLAKRHITKELCENSFKSDKDYPFDFVIVKHWTSLPIAMLMQGNPKIWLDINEVFEAEHDNSKLWQLIYKPVIIRLLKLAERQIVLRSATSLEQIKYMNDDAILHLPNTKKPLEKAEVKQKSSEKIKLLYHGLIAPNRSLETAIKALYHSERPDLELTIRGSGKPKYIAKLKALAERLQLSSHVHFKPSIENSKLIETASHYDIGLCLFDNQSQQLMLAEPNKIYEYMAAGLGIIASETPTMKRMIEAEKIGELTIISNDQVNALTQIFQNLSQEKVKTWQRKSHIQASKTWQDNYDWNKLDLSLKQIQQDSAYFVNKR